MTRRVISSGTGSDGSATTPENQTSHGRSIQSRKHSDAGKQVQPKGRSVAGGAGRASSSGKKTQENTVESGNKGSVSRSRSGDFVDARNLAGEDFVSKTLEETIGTLGVVTRPTVVDFSARLKERRKANARVVAMRACVSAAVIVVAGALVWLFFFSSVFRLESGNISVVGANEWVSAQTIHVIADKQAGKSLFLVSAHEVTEQLKSIPGVSEAKVSKQFPKSMSVEVKAQRPAAMLKRGDTLTAVDSQARVLNSVKNANVDGIPVIEVKDIDASLKNRSVKETLTILGALPASMRKSITKVTAETQDSVTTTLNDGDRVIIWGDSSQLKLKLAEVEEIDKNITAGTAGFAGKHQIDVSSSQKPIIK